MLSIYGGLNGGCRSAQLVHRGRSTELALLKSIGRITVAFHSLGNEGVAQWAWRGAMGGAWRKGRGVAQGAERGLIKPFFVTDGIYSALNLK